MAKNPPVPPIPPLSVAKAHEIDAIQGKLVRVLEHCMDPDGQIGDELKVKTYLSSYVVEIFQEYLGAYVASPNLKLWIPELKLNASKWVLSCLSDYRGVTDEDIERYGGFLLTTLDEHVKSTFSAFGNSANPILAALAEPQPNAKLASAYAASGVDVDSGSPLLRMAIAAGNRAQLQPPNAYKVAPPLTITPSKPQRLSAQVTCPSAAQKMQKYIDAQGMNQTEFAIQAGTSDKTIRKFRQTGKVKRSILTGIASAMGITKEELLKQ